MNIANKITILRIILIPIFMIFMLIDVSYNMEIALGIFLIASFTDKLDGYYARKYNLVTDLGKFLDPLADKLLVTAAFLSFIELGRIEAWIVFIILAREFAVTGLRGIAANKKIVIAASNMGKVKTVTQIITIIILFLDNYPFTLINVPMDIICIYITLIITIVSGADYFIKYFKAFKNQI
ncbi:CDP-diacylglycerol--glycerol-3-phosphate 3-phosphatidyltransferase [Lutispora thermophila]|uniref:CDP-diacylglycerol--glycerol-3-phosphate 3-phosphatidyltransferase n=1 Tax=Lutispora thermophila DSM 19022 TaxID=1122184 RepID=A0A1M6I5X3_9FIRM|nr:CDP-diacylglycerol--glycerol-3-phosphate 3-phosphatidyltransferase [Lutispora thermophila]SHJ29857.1 CDP-diacylglycerol--glycerol-3-phosphate 3-phosphatidyltransferase [Lutispora thermophila DSM 19022]